MNRVKRATHQIFGTHADSPHSSLWFSDSMYHSSTPFFFWCTQNIRCSGRCSSLGSPSPCSPLQPAVQSPHRKTLNIHRRQTQDALSSIHALPWRKLFSLHLLYTLLLVYASLWMLSTTELCSKYAGCIFCNKKKRKIQIRGNFGIDTYTNNWCVKVEPVCAPALIYPSVRRTPPLRAGVGY